MNAGDGEEYEAGGLLADFMGLGKTVQVIATIVANNIPGSGRSKSNLLVALKAVLKQ